MKEKLLQYLTTLDVNPQHDRVLLAVSGGQDSMVMLHLFFESRLSFGVAHVNFQLRGKESDEDEQFVKTWCVQHKIPFFSDRFETNNYATSKKVSIQMAARELRYTWFDELIQKEGFRYVATAHHLNDSIETVFINLTRGTGLEGLVGIPAKKGNRIRPLLFASKMEIETYAAESGVIWREDSSNQTDDYQRNFIRHTIVPALKKINPSLEETFKETVAKIQSELNLIEREVEQWKETYWREEDSMVRINKAGVTKQTLASVWYGIKPFGFSFTQCDEVLRALAGQSGKYFLSASHKLVVDRDFIVLSKIEEPLGEVFIDSHQNQAILGNYKIDIKRVEQAKPDASNRVAILDADRVSFPIIWRKWRPGDYFFPLGMEHRKKISDFLIDQKISITEKDSITVLESAGEILWVVGQRIDNRYKLTPTTRQALSLTITS
ncbi:MAG: tRNA lysidine(34) synthetase TilS [Cyclobacteriaceae bacterium]|nr:tRNA lysidine(34) synthetase TilS [Cyclobacteriaceae bacterium]